MLLLRLLAALSLAIVSQPGLAHGTEQHEEATTQSVEGPAAESERAIDARGKVTPGQPEAQHDARSGSIWTKLHPATVHFPIALLLMAALTELMAIIRPATGLSGAVRIMIWGGAAGAVVAAIFGWIHTGIWLGGDATMQWHRWTGTGLAVAAPIAALLFASDNRLPFRALLFLIAATLLVQGYWGGELAHGPRHLGI